MEVKYERGKTSLESSKKLISCNVYKWKIPNFLILPEYKDIDFEINSPSFEFQNATWCFSIDSYKNSKDIFSVYIHRLKTEIPTHMLCFKFAFSNADLKCNDFSLYCVINEPCKRKCLKDFKYDFSFQDECDTLTVTALLFEFENTKVDAKQVSLEKDSSYKRTVEIMDNKISFESTTKTVSSGFYSFTFPKFLFTSDDNKEDEDDHSDDDNEDDEDNQDDHSDHDDKKEAEICSRTFNFANKTCCFRIVGTNGCYGFKVFLDVINAENSLKSIFAKFILTNCDGKFIINTDFYEVDFKKNYKDMFAFFKHYYFPSYTLHVHLIAEEDLEVDADPALMRARGSDLLFQDFKKMFLTGEDSDLTLKVAEKEFRVHRLILKARSKVFEAMLSHDMIEQNNGIVNIPDVDARAMELLLLYMYSGDMDGLDSDNALGVYYAADKYNLMFLKEVCAEFIKKSLSPSIVCHAIQLALNHNDKDLLERCTEYFVNNTGDVLITAEWMSFMKANPIAANELYIKANKK